MSSSLHSHFVLVSNCLTMPSSPADQKLWGLSGSVFTSCIPLGET